MGYNCSAFFCFTGKRRYNIKLWKTFTDCFNCLPIAAIIDEKIFTMHGGLSPDLQSMEQIRRVMRPTDVPDTGEFGSATSRDSRPSCYSKKIRILIAHIHRAFMRFAMVRSRQGHHWLVGKRQRRIIHIWAGCRLAILTKARYGLDLSSSPGACTFFSSLVAHIATSTRRW